MESAFNQSHSRGPQKYPFDFTGKGGEYFKIWIVNILLTVVTLGIYAAWAKVRNNQYFYGNTFVDGSSFNYTANPVNILKGRLIAVFLLIVYQAAVYFYPTNAGYAIIAIGFIVPMIVVTSLAFKMRYSSWRGIHFSFERDYKSAYLLFLPVILYFIAFGIFQIMFGADMQQMENNPEEMDEAAFEGVMAGFTVFGIVVFICVLLFPWWQNKYYDFVGNHVNFGQSGMTYSESARSFYAMYIIAFAIPFVLIFVFAAVVKALNIQQYFLMGETPPAEVIVAMIVVFLLGLFLIQMLPAAFIKTRRTNIVYNALTIDEVEVVSELKLGKMFYLYCTNTIAILLTLGLAIPWAKVRMARYRAETMFLMAPSLETFVADSKLDESAQGDAISDVFDLDIGL